MLDSLMEMNRDKDRTHLRDLVGVGVVQGAADPGGAVEDS
jgi:hypothetical protein